MAKRKIALVTPGEVLRSDFLAPMGISAYRLAADTGMTQTRVKEILDGTRSVTVDLSESKSQYLEAFPCVSLSRLTRLLVRAKRLIRIEHHEIGFPSQLEPELCIIFM